jgi:hypothetical protein
MEWRDTVEGHFWRVLYVMLWIRQGSTLKTLKYESHIVISVLETLEVML